MVSVIGSPVDYPVDEKQETIIQHALERLRDLPEDSVFNKPRLGQVTHPGGIEIAYYKQGNYIHQLYYGGLPSSFDSIYGTPIVIFLQEIDSLFRIKTSADPLGHR